MKHTPWIFDENLTPDYECYDIYAINDVGEYDPKVAEVYSLEHAQLITAAPTL